VTTVSNHSSRWRLTFHICRYGFSRSYWMGRIDCDPVANEGTGKMGLAMTGRGVAGGFVTVTIRFCWLFVLK
jgi:hypothetical protein